MKTDIKGYYTLPEIKPYCKEVRVLATQIEDLGNGRVLLRDDEMASMGASYMIETDKANFTKR